MKARQHLPLHLIQGQPADKSVSDTASAARWSAVNPVPTGVFTLRAHSDGFMGCAGCGLLVSATWYEIVPVYVWESVHSLCALFNANCLWSRSYALRVLKYRNNIICHKWHLNLVKASRFNPVKLILNLCYVRSSSGQDVLLFLIFTSFAYWHWHVTGWIIMQTTVSKMTTKLGFAQCSVWRKSHHIQASQQTGRHSSPCLIIPR